VFNNNWMLDQYFTAKSKQVNRFFGQFALPFEHGEFDRNSKASQRLAANPLGALARPRHAAF
jgi:hypothetical protein